MRTRSSSRGSTDEKHGRLVDSWRPQSRQCRNAKPCLSVYNTSALKNVRIPEPVAIPFPLADESIHTRRRPVLHHVELLEDCVGRIVLRDAFHQCGGIVPLS
ncbi:hypothetical protein PUNSTDRAFT_146965 [Punctularia strigosozonata HHB-11173 SS5]|uniref:Uncharacterized protein n=1 Tax=Punctularia strigosozonata (strain HHB-11173) TaxID=741275 RepID=R7S1I2_PUNST|nr:uncharacterized protein PUNSTDRAFT_146965 [Punctularia strigosozonata HHB-11173 SS5]EIN03642.1 hypothetical protein PUNSTDRAFT_146965 [Punctularia strigosozonata HHB-11173 SS5]